MVPLTERLTNGQFLANLAKLTGPDAQTIRIRVRQRTCACGCGDPVRSTRKFVNQVHYDAFRSQSKNN